MKFCKKLLEKKAAGSCQTQLGALPLSFLVLVLSLATRCGGRARITLLPGEATGRRVSCTGKGSPEPGGSWEQPGKRFQRYANGRYANGSPGFLTQRYCNHKVLWVRKKDGDNPFPLQWL